MSIFTRTDGPLDQGWLPGLLRGRYRLQSISFTIYLDRDCWRWGAERFKGSLYFFAGPFGLDIGA
jgi:hypothetical protein